MEPSSLADHDEAASHPGDPMTLFVRAFARARATEPFDATAISLATVDAQGRPSVRTVLLKGADERGFVFFTNYESRKARELDGQRVAAIGIHWPKSDQQTRAEGPVERVTPAESDAYFSTRPRQSQIGAWSSDQSRPLRSREELEARVRELEARFAGGSVPRPPHWGGYRLMPVAVEFWYAGAGRLHDRFRYERDPGAPLASGAWSFSRLYP